MNKNSINNYYIRDFLLWIFFIFLVIFIADLSLEYQILKHILVLLMSFIVFYRMFFLKTKYVHNIKELVLLFIIIVQIYNNTYTNYLYNNFFGYLLFINIIFMCVPAFFDKNYNLGIQLILLSIFTPIYYGYYQNFSKNNKYLWDITYISIFFTVCIFEHSIRHWSLFGLLSIIPMLINFNNNPFLYRLIGLSIQLIIYNYGFFYSQNKNKKSLFINTENISLNFHYLADLVFKYNDWKTNKLYYIFIIINYILLYKTFIFMKTNNIKTFIT